MICFWGHKKTDSRYSNKSEFMGFLENAILNPFFFGVELQWRCFSFIVSMHRVLWTDFMKTTGSQQIWLNAICTIGTTSVPSTYPKTSVRRKCFHQDAAVTLLCILFVVSAVRCVRSLKRWADPASNVTGFTSEYGRPFRVTEND